jgi:hypothetical protein
MKNKILVVGVLSLAFVFAVNVYAVGQGSGTGTGMSTQNQQQTQTANQGENSQIQIQNNEQVQNGSGTGEQVKNQNQEQEKVQQQQQEQTNAEEHRSTVANFVQCLLEVASTIDSGIGQQVRIIAQQQNQSASTTIQAIEKVQTRNKVKTFFFGSDYKNLGALRSETVQTRNRLEQLNRLMENIQNEGDKIELQNQIQALEQEQIKIESFIKTQESKFSLFGWLVKLFNK